MDTETDLTAESARSTWRIGAVIDQTGVSRELIHHYLRQGLLPKPEERARYDLQQIRLLNLIRKLREEHNLPLEVIRQVFELFDFDPDRIEPLALSESLYERLSRFAEGADLLRPRTLSRDELVNETGITSERLEAYIEAGLVASEQEAGRFSSYEANLIGLCEHGLRIGIPFESFRTIGAYIRVAFELEHAEFYRIEPRSDGDADAVLKDLFVRSAVAASFIQNMLSALSGRRLRELLEPGGEPAPGLDAVVFRPSSAFVRRHGLEARIAEARERLLEGREAPAPWLDLARLLVHAGLDHEAAFFLEEALRKWPDEHRLGSLYGRVLILSGQTRRGRKRLEAVLQGHPDDPTAGLYLTLSDYYEAAATDRSEAFIQRAALVVRRLDALLARPREGPDGAATEARLLGGWLLTRLPAVLGQRERGVAVMLAEHRELEAGCQDGSEIPGLTERYRIHAAHLLLQTADLPADAPDRERLETLIYRLDPQCAFAEAAYLGHQPSAPRGGSK